MRALSGLVESGSRIGIVASRPFLCLLCIMLSLLVQNLYSPSIWPRPLTIVSFLLLLLPTLLPAQVEGRVFFRNVADSSLRQSSGRLVMLPGGDVGIEDQSGDDGGGLQVIPRRSVTRIELLRKGEGRHAALGVLLGGYLPVLVNGHLDQTFLDDGILGLEPAFILEWGSGVEMMAGIGMLVGGGIGFLVDHIDDDTRRIFSFVEEGGDSSESWSKLERALKRERAPAVRLSMAGGHLLGSPRTGFREHQYRLGDSTGNSRYFIGEWPGPGELQWLRAVELTIALTSVLEGGIGMYDLSIGSASNAILMPNDSLPPNESVGLVTTTVTGAGYGVVLTLRIPDNPDPFEASLGVGAGLATMHIGEEADVPYFDGRPRLRDYQYSTTRSGGFCLLSGGISAEVADNVSFGVRADLALLPGTVLPHPMSHLPQDTQGFSLSTSTLGFVIGYQF